jgi:protein kinase C substrate 80K-H
MYLTPFLTGPDDVFAVLVDQCFDIRRDKFTYEVCAYGRAEQKESGKGGTSLGDWKGWKGHRKQSNEQVPEHPTMVFEGGASCWQGPQRSVTVELHCADGPAHELTFVEEPSKCVYFAKMDTPLACDPAELVRLKAELEAASA